MQVEDEKTEQIYNEENGPKKTYINCICFQLSVGITYTYIYIIASIFVNIVNRIIFLTYQFKFNFTFLFLQQILVLILFSFFGNKSKKFQEKAGEISFNDFLTNKYYYLIFSAVFMFNILSSFRANQELVNITMFVTLRKFVLLFIFFIDFFGIFVVFLNNIATVIYIKFTENFREKTGFTNLKLLYYNSYLINPILILLIFITGEHKQIYTYFHNNNINNLGLYFYISLSCILCVILNSTFFLSNEKNSSIITQLLSNSKDIFVSGLSFIMLKNNNFSLYKLIGLIISTTGAIFISSKSIIDNLKLGFYEEKKYYIQIPELNDDKLESNKL